MTVAVGILQELPSACGIVDHLILWVGVTGGNSASGSSLVRDGQNDNHNHFLLCF